MKNLFQFLCSVIIMLSSIAVCASTRGEGQFVGVRNGRFYVHNQPYNFIGTNFWYGNILASDGEGGDQARLDRELDQLQSIGIDNLRIMVGAEGENEIPSHIRPTLQIAPGVYNDTLLVGLDRLLANLEKRGMKCVIFLNNAWEWSGGYGIYCEWAGEGKCPVPSIDGWQLYMKWVQKFLRNEEAQRLAQEHARNMVTRVNSITGKPYTESPAIMSWQIANEPRAFSEENKPKLAAFIQKTAQLIQSLDANHMVSTGSEGFHGCEDDWTLFTQIHAFPEIDYCNIHIWPYNWSWISQETVVSQVDHACRNTKQYISDSYRHMKPIGKPIVLEEFGYPRDGFVFTPGSPTVGRDIYYNYVFSIMKKSNMIAGCNFWGWGGEVRPQHQFWQLGDGYIGDPAQEEQGLNSVFDCDYSTIEIIKKSIIQLKK